MKLYIIDCPKKEKNKLYTQLPRFTSLNKFRTLIIITLFIATFLIASNVMGQEVVVLKPDSPNTLIRSGENSVMVEKQEITKTLSAISETNNNSTLYIGIMVHLEGYNLDDDTVYNSYKNDINTLVGIFNEYGAKLTLELKEPITACVKRNDFYFKAFEEAGHGIGVHADVGGMPKPYDTWQDNSFLMKKMKEELQKQGVSVRHISGYCSPLDWVSAVIEAGYSFVTGGVSWCLMSLPEENIPEEYASCKNPAECHDNYPPQLIDRLHPWIIKRGYNWTEHHSDGELVYFPAAIEGLPYLSEKKLNPNFNGNPSFDDEDIEVYIEQLEEALSMVDDSQPNFAYVSWSYGKKMPDDFARKWLSAIKPYIDSGKVQWKTIPEMYDIYINKDDTFCKPLLISEIIIPKTSDDFDKIPVKVSSSSNALVFPYSFKSSVKDSFMNMDIKFPCYTQPVDTYIAVVFPDGTPYFLSKEGKLTLEFVPLSTNTTVAKNMSLRFTSLYRGDYVIYWASVPTNGGDIFSVNWGGYSELGYWTHSIK